MTDEELIKALRMRSESDLCRDAANRIEALVKESAEMEAEAHAHIELWGKALREKAAAEARAERLEEALRSMLEAAKFMYYGTAFEKDFRDEIAALKGEDHV